MTDWYLENILKFIHLIINSSGKLELNPREFWLWVLIAYSKKDTVFSKYTWTRRFGTENCIWNIFRRQFYSTYIRSLYLPGTLEPVHGDLSFRCTQRADNYSSENWLAKVDLHKTFWHRKFLLKDNFTVHTFVRKTCQAHWRQTTKNLRNRLNRKCYRDQFHFILLWGK